VHENDKTEITDRNDVEEELDQQIKLVITEAFPVLLGRLKKAAFADWHRSNQLENDLANETIFRFAVHVKKTDQFPENTIAYLITIAKNVAFEDYKKREQDWTYLDKSVNTEDFVAQDTQQENEKDESEGVDPIRQVRLEWISAAIEALPRLRKQAYRLYLNNPSCTTYKELGAIMGISEDAFRMHVDRAESSICLFLLKNDIIH
jgi:DNA-directed RNA polymerase specialized sigma subunit, sigma24 homolog